MSDVDVSDKKLSKIINLIPTWGPILLMILIVALSSHFATKDEFKILDTDLKKVQENQLIIIEQSKVNNTQESSLKDHEVRIRTLEKEVFQLYHLKLY